MRLHFILLTLVPGLVPAPASSADPSPAKPFSAYAVLKTEPTPHRAGCRVSRGDGGELRATLYSSDTAACPVARVVEDEIPLGELANALAAVHMEMGSKASKGAKPQGMDFKPQLDRIIDVRLIVLEAKEMGLQEQPDYRQAMDAFRASTLRTTLQIQASAGAKPDPAQVDKLYKAAVKQWKVQSVMFDKEEDAKAFREAVGMGGSFDALARAAVAEKKGR
jgi:hypothetical protein